MKCKKHQQASHDMWPGHILTEWSCKICGRTFLHPNKCCSCSKQYNICIDCGEPLNGQS